MAVTPNYSWPVPDDTDLVKDGAEAIRDLGNAIDTTVDGLPGAGLVHIKQVDTGGAVSSVSVNDCFSADFTHYKIISNLLGSGANASCNVRMRVSGADNSSTVYHRQTMTAGGTGVTASRPAAVTYFENFGGAIDSASKNLTIVEIANPFQTEITTAQNILSFDTNAQATISMEQNVYGMTITDSFTGFSAIAGSGTLNGVIDVYGYKLG